MQCIVMLSGESQTGWFFLVLKLHQEVSAIIGLAAEKNWNKQKTGEWTYLDTIIQTSNKKVGKGT